MNDIVFEVGTRIMITTITNRGAKGEIKYIGNVEGQTGTIYGVRLDVC